MENEPLIKIAAAAHAFLNDKGKHDRAFENVSFTVRQGEFLSIVGPSGCGKSTLLRAIAGLLAVREGNILSRFRKPAMVFQNFALFPWLSAVQNVEFGLAMAGVAKHKRRRIAEEKIAEVGLHALQKKYPRELSGGERQRVGVARALAVNPDVLLMDEPFSSLDSIIAEKLKTDVSALWQKYKITVVMVNHLIPDAIELSDRIVVMAGRPGTVKEIISVDTVRPRDKRSSAFFALEDKITKLIED